MRLDFSIFGNFSLILRLFGVNLFAYLFCMAQRSYMYFRKHFVLSVDRGRRT